MESIMQTMGQVNRLCLTLLFSAATFTPVLFAAMPGATVISFLPPSPGNPRNTEGSFVTLRNGRILFAYSKFTGGGDDNDRATIAGRYSNDGGKTWDAKDVTLVEREGDMNVMSVSLLRLKDRRIAMFYIRKNSVSDCRPYLRYSSDETASWTEPVLCVPDSGYFVLNNDRVVQLRSGRLVLPVALHKTIDGKFGSRGEVMTYFSDDAGRTWRRSSTILGCPTPSRAGFQEPGLVELKGGRLLMLIRTMLGSQYISYSRDGGDTWSDAGPSSIASPLSPASVKRIPSTGDLLMVWNDHSSVEPELRATETSGGKRTPLTVAISKDEGKTWTNRRNILDDADGWYCYTAIHFVDKRVLLAFASGGRGQPRLSNMDLASFEVKNLYK